MTENEAKKLITRFCEDRMNFARGKDMSDIELEDFCKFSDALTLSVSSLEEIQQYRAIGTVEECREAREKQKGKKPIILSEQSAESEGKLYIAKYFKCPTCGNTSTYFGGLPNNCHNCGQSLESNIS